MKKVVLVTGVAGFIGSNLAIELLKKGYRVLGVDNLSQSTSKNIEPLIGRSDFEFLKCDVRDTPQVTPWVNQADAIVHLAAFKIPRYSNATETLAVNTHGTLSLLKANLKKKARFIMASTSDAYGMNPDIPFSEDKALWMGQSHVKRWAYALSKVFDERQCFGFYREHGIPTVIVRLFGGYGPHQNLTWWGGPQSVFIGAALRDQTMELHGDGLQTRSFTYVSDHVNGFIRCIESEAAVGQVINLGNTEEITILALAQKIWGLAGKGQPKIHFIPYETFGKYEDVRRRVPDLSRAKYLIGYEPQVSLTEGLKATIEWQRNQN